MEDCIFCKIARKEIPVEIVAESANFIAFPDKNPSSEGHTLIVPKAHFRDVVEMPSELGNELLEIVKKTWKLRESEGAEGFNLLANTKEAAGQLVMHFHLHLIPRKKGDNVRFKTI